MRRSSALKAPGGVFALLIAGVISLLAALPADAAALKNYTVFFYQPGIAVTGTLRGGQFTQAFTYTMNEVWTAAAADRDSLLLYNSKTGAAQTGILFDSSYAKKHRYTLPTGYMITASCDTVMMYKPGTGKVLTMTLTQGVLGTRHSSSVATSNPYESLAASCSTYAMFQKVSDATNAHFRAGRLKSGLAYATGSSSIAKDTIDIPAMTDDSFFLYGPNTYYGTVGTVRTAKGGVLTETNRFGSVGTLDIIAGSPDTLLMYNRTTGIGYLSTLVGVVYTYKSTVGFSSGWQIIAAGK